MSVSEYPVLHNCDGCITVTAFLFAGHRHSYAIVTVMQPSQLCNVRVMQFCSYAIVTVMHSIVPHTITTCFTVYPFESVNIRHHPSRIRHGNLGGRHSYAIVTVMQSSQLCNVTVMQPSRNFRLCNVTVMQSRVFRLWQYSECRPEMLLPLIAQIVCMLQSIEHWISNIPTWQF